MTIVNRVPPFSEDAEQAVLSAVLADSSALITAVDVIGAEMFYVERHRRLFRAMLELAELGIAVTPITLAEKLATRAELEPAGGKDYIGFLLDVVPSAQHIAHHA